MKALTKSVQCHRRKHCLKVDACVPPVAPSVPGASVTPSVPEPKDVIVTPEPRGHGAHAGSSGDKPEAPQKRRADNQDVCLELFPAGGSPDAKKPAGDAEAPKDMKKPAAVPKSKVRAGKKIKLPPDEDKQSKPRGADKGQRATRGDALTFAGHRPPADPDLREQFLCIRKEYMDQKAAYKADKKGKKKSDSVRNWTPHATQLEYLQFMKIQMAKLKETAATTQEKFTSASEAWKDHCIEKGYLKSVPVDDNTGELAPDINLDDDDGAEMKEAGMKEAERSVAEEMNCAEMSEEHLDAAPECRWDFWFQRNHGFISSLHPTQIRFRVCR